MIPKNINFPQSSHQIEHTVQMGRLTIETINYCESFPQSVFVLANMSSGDRHC